MTRHGFCLLALVVAAPLSAWGQQAPPAADQPVAPNDPSIQARPNAAQAPPPFVLSAAEEAQLDQMLASWEHVSARIKHFRCQFTRYEYDPVFGPANEPRFVDKGEVRFAAPDRGSYVIEEPRPEKWLSTGESIVEYNYARKQVVEHKLPPELRGRAITDGPLPFLFGSTAARLKQRYFLRIVTPKDVQQNELWLQALPRFQAERANFERAELILTLPALQPMALQVHLPNGKSRTVHRFENVQINDPLRFLQGNPFAVDVPSGWQKTVEEPLPIQANREGAAPAR